ncbi:site-specific DNA-methyltransferase [Methanofollis ethanolicus]|uniref:site-specific DNA-methyltransferase n=1 Tax=Methanofollis ethanolicus TaxID=488124 RepID=UPI00083731A3|nr:site-specific DNA-methyltransferase [Methanofollis ethanolicus]
MSDNSVSTLQKLLRQLFQINEETADLDFGIYRIMHLKKGAVDAFIQNDIAQIADMAALKEAVSSLARELGVDPECDEAELERVQQVNPANAELFRTKRDLLRRAADIGEAGRNDVFNHLISFLSRYYDEGDFMPLPRASSSRTYAVPYNGEEVMLYWANKDQYYIKTGEHFQNFLFRVGEYTVRFRLRDAETEQNNTRDERRYFMLHPKYPLEYDEKAKTLTIWFEYRQISTEENKALGQNAQAKLVEQAYDAIRMWDGIAFTGLQASLCQSPAKGQKSLLERKLAQYVRRNTSDYFIHKNLGPFLRQELDFYIKNEMMNLDAIGTGAKPNLQPYVDRIWVMKYLANQVIDFLAQMENFQKKLWEKKKFVLQTDYCMTIDHIPEKHYPAICANERQVQEWKNLYGIGEGAQQTLGGGKIDVAFLKGHPYLMLDTAFFDATFKDHLLEDLQHPDGTPVTDLEEAIGGLLIKSENWQALNLLQERYKEQVKCIYIDPPYNTGNDGFLYKDNYRHSSWLSMIKDRILCSMGFLSDDGSFFSSIDDNEADLYEVLLKEIYSPTNFLATLVWQKRYSPPPDTSNFGYMHELIFAFRSSEKFQRNLLPLTEEQIGRYRNPDNDPRGPWKPTDYTCRYTVDERSNLNYPIINPYTHQEIWPNYSRAWAFSQEVHKINENENRIWWGSDGSNNVPSLKNFLSEIQQGSMPTTILFHDTVGHTDEAAKELRAFFPNIKFTVKPTRLVRHLIQIGANKDSLIQDFFAGSGTTAHAVLNMNKEDDGTRKYILVEMADYFDTVMKPRIEKVAYSSNWKGGKPQDTDGQSHMFKYLTLESYEDTLNNIEFSARDSVQKSLFDLDGYFLRYMLDVESRESLCRMNHSTLDRPFDYTLARKTASQDNIARMPVDLVETFNYLLGIHVTTLRTEYNGEIKYRVVTGEKASENGMETYLIIWRTTAGWGAAELASDRTFVTEKIMAGREFDHIHMNDRFTVAKAKKIEDSFHRLMEGDWDAIRPAA